ncbi:MAG: site-specific DNA-methyltransferase [Acidaminococcales bacterium]|jgi:site-specific DNA-methyltransferase (adenine-specific)|nr:site-specific DNA-methyltransferase [Acidaminococcales bacterium]
MKYLDVNRVYCGDARDLLPKIYPNSISLSVWSPPYHVGKDYEKTMTYGEWVNLLSIVIELHFNILKPGGFLAINIADILCYKDGSMPQIMAENVSRRKVSITKEQILEAWSQHATYSRKQIAELMGCSEQTIDRRINGNNVRGGKYSPQTRVKLAGNILEDAAYKSSLYLYDRRIWVKDPAWENSRWHTISYRAIDEFEYVYIFWKPGITTIDRSRLSKDEWINWGSRAVWNIASVRANDNHESKYPIELPRRLIQLLTVPGETVLDCFIGSGTSAVAAIIEDRNYIGIDKEPKSVHLTNLACKDAFANKVTIENARMEGENHFNKQAAKRT